MEEKVSELLKGVAFGGLILGLFVLTAWLGVAVVVRFGPPGLALFAFTLSLVFSLASRALARRGR